jgi:hypothetical protein
MVGKGKEEENQRKEVEFKSCVPLREEIRRKCMGDQGSMKGWQVC